MPVLTVIASLAGLELVGDSGGIAPAVHSMVLHVVAPASGPSATTTTTEASSGSGPVVVSVKPAPTPPTTTSTTATTTAEPSPSSGNITAEGTNLMLDGSTYKFLGYNAYELATDWGTNAGCGGMLSDSQLDDFFASLPPSSLVRFWAFQGSMATNVKTGQLDWAPLDRVFDAAAQYHVKLIPVLTDQGGTCDGGHWQDPSWYEGGFEDVFNGPTNSNGQGLDSLSYDQYLVDVVNRYKDSPALGMWEPISEAEASTCPPQDEPDNCGGNQTCPNEAAAAAALRYFFDFVGAQIHSLDPDHLVESGLLGGGQCGTSGSDYQYVSASPGIDVLSYHDYYGAAPVGGDQWNGLAVRFEQAAALDKPIIGGEVGIQAGPGAGCTSLSARVSEIQVKEQAQFADGSSGLLIWNWGPSTDSTCSYDTYPGDPLVGFVDAGVNT